MNISREARAYPILRMIDANLNRIGEGLRLLEDVARLLLNDSDLTQQLKTMRHELRRGDWSFHQQLLQSRDVEGDVGASTEVPIVEKQREVPLMVLANARRVQESLRLMEELAKTPDITPGLDSDKYRQARFALYAIEQKLLARLQRQDKLRQISGLYVIIDTPSLRGHSHLEAAEKAIRGGARTIQLRDKLMTKNELLPIAQQLRKLCSENRILFIINDYLDLTLAADADGLHLGPDDLPLKIARRLLPGDRILGVSVATVEQAITAEAEGADYAALGAIYPTASKEKVEVVGLERLSEVRKAVTLPLVAVGGINRDNIAEVISAGADAVAVISAVLRTDDIEAAARQIAERTGSQHE